MVCLQFSTLLPLSVAALVLCCKKAAMERWNEKPWVKNKMTGDIGDFTFKNWNFSPLSSFILLIFISIQLKKKTFFLRNNLLLHSLRLLYYMWWMRITIFFSTFRGRSTIQKELYSYTYCQQSAVGSWLSARITGWPVYGVYILGDIYHLNIWMCERNVSWCLKNVWLSQSYSF